MKCDVCTGTMNPDVLLETYRCPFCGFYKSVLPVRINEVERIDEAARQAALRPIRLANFQQLLDECAELLPRGASILDVGCAHGWFLAAATTRGYQAKGIEPDRAVADLARVDGHDVVTGFFPDDLISTERFDAVTFNDVFEHVSDVKGVASAVQNCLNPGGLFIVNLPVSDGFIFRLARLAGRVGVTGPLRRMWQHGLPSPHLSYFSVSTLPQLVDQAGFDLVKKGSLQSISANGLYQRIRYDRNVSPAKAALLYAAARVIKAASGVVASDAHYFVFRRVNPTRAA